MDLCNRAAQRANGAFSILPSSSSSSARRVPPSAFGRACAARDAAGEAQTSTNLHAKGRGVELVANNDLGRPAQSLLPLFFTRY